MPAVEISDWRKGCNSVAAIKEIRAKAGIPLNEALALVNRVLANEKVVVYVPGLDEASKLVDDLAGIGMIAHVLADSRMEPTERP